MKGKVGVVANKASHAPPTPGVAITLITIPTLIAIAKTVIVVIRVETVVAVAVTP